ncbi:hypothetical protein Zmor_013627 [Zophobas morio]|uniref:Uncharacterized protein n=1 Tax=Zophobas morio TaxID=2755281 RepID=A0AA38IFY6_9CUCU|nr:hypothetical protein Zmor_013627 [Zophobas morio]
MIPPQSKENKARKELNRRNNATEKREYFTPPIYLIKNLNPSYAPREVCNIPTCQNAKYFMHPIRQSRPANVAFEWLMSSLKVIHTLQTHNKYARALSTSGLGLGCACRRRGGGGLSNVEFRLRASPHRISFT